MTPTGASRTSAPDWLGEPGGVSRDSAAMLSGRRRTLRLIKFALPLVALLLLGVMFMWPQLSDQQEGRFGLSFTSVSAVSTDLRMTSPRFTGADAHNRAYVVTAASATQNLLDHAQVALEAMEAEIALNAESWLSVRATTGEIHTQRQQLRLSGAVDAYSDLGYEFHATEARIDLDAGTMESSAPVQAQGGLGRLRANTMRTEDRGQRIWFTGDVQVTIYPQKGGPS